MLTLVIGYLVIILTGNQFSCKECIQKMAQLIIEFHRPDDLKTVFQLIQYNKLDRIGGTTDSLQ